MQSTSEQAYIASQTEEPARPKEVNVRRIGRVLTAMQNDYNTTQLIELHSQALAQLSIRKDLLKMRRIEGLDEIAEKIMQQCQESYLKIMEEIYGLCIDKSLNPDDY